jgi:hypothetical protein
VALLPAVVASLAVGTGGEERIDERWDSTKTSSMPVRVVSCPYKLTVND